MARPPKYDYTALYEEFVESKHESLLPFLKDKKIISKGGNIGEFSNSVQNKFKGWAGKKKAQLSMASVEAKVEVVASSIDKWKKVYKNIEGAEMQALQDMATAIILGEPVYELTEDGVAALENGRPKIKGYRPLSVFQKQRIWTTLRTAQGKASDVILNMVMSATGEENANPLKRRLEQMREEGKLDVLLLEEEQ